jgi:hypothetical protein
MTGTREDLSMIPIRPIEKFSVADRLSKTVEVRIPLVRSQQWHLYPNFLYQSQDEHVCYRCFFRMADSVVVSLPCDAKQCTEISQTYVGMSLPHSFDCLAPGFFLILILSSSSLTWIIVCSPSIFSLAFSKAFWSSITCLESAFTVEVSFGSFIGF